MRTEKKRRLAQRRHLRVRQQIRGTAQRPRMSVRFTGQYVYVQFIDDERGQTLAATSSASISARAQGAARANVAGAQQVGKLAAEVARASGIQRVVFDRGSALYHGKVKALADAAREGGLKF